MILVKSYSFVRNVYTTTKNVLSSIKFQFSISSSHIWFKNCSRTITTRYRGRNYNSNVEFLWFNINCRYYSTNDWLNKSSSSSSRWNTNIRWINYVIISTAVYNFNRRKRTIINFIICLRADNFYTIYQHSNSTRDSLITIPRLIDWI